MSRSTILAALACFPPFWWFWTPLPPIKPGNTGGTHEMVSATYGPRSIFNDIMRGDTDLILVGDSQSTYAQYRAMHGWVRNLPATVTVCGRIWSGDIESNQSGTQVQSPGTGASGAVLDLIAATSDSEAVASWCPRDSYQITFSGNMSDGTRMVAFKHRAVTEAGMYPGGDPFLAKRVRMWPIHRASNATERIAGGGYRIGTFVSAGQAGAYVSVTMGTGGGLEKANNSIILEADQYVASVDAFPELRVVPLAGGNETGDIIQFGGAVMHVVDADGNRGTGLVFGACFESSWAASDWNANFTQAVWQNFYAAVTTGPDQTVIAIMLGHNAESGTYSTNIATELSKHRAAFFAATGVYPKFLLVAPWESNDANSMDATKNAALKSLVGVGTAYGDVACVSLYDAFYGLDPGMTGLHPASNAETDLSWGELWDQIRRASLSARARDGRTRETLRIARTAP